MISIIEKLYGVCEKANVLACLGSLIVVDEETKD